MSEDYAKEAYKKAYKAGYSLGKYRGVEAERLRTKKEIEKMIFEIPLMKFLTQEKEEQAVQRTLEELKTRLEAKE